MVDKDFVFSRIGMALVSAQRVEFITNQLVKHLSEFDKDVYGITGEEFLAATHKANLARATLGKIFNTTLFPFISVEKYLLASSKFFAAATTSMLLFLHNAMVCKTPSSPESRI